VGALAATGVGMTAALGVNPGTHARAGHRVRHLRADDLRHHARHRVRHALHRRHRHHLGDSVRHRLGDGVRHLLADSVRHHLGHAFLDHLGAGHRLADAPRLHDLTGTHLVGTFGGAALPVALLVLAAAGARIEAAGVGRARPRVRRLAALAVRLGAALLDAVMDRLAGRHRRADGLGAGLVAGLHALAVARLADLLVAGLADRLAGGAAHVLVAGLADRLADRMAALTHALLAILVAGL